tara:strand:+ start:1959 stop:2717 length:759 start_codon:yes stop_codon:yes gene_type:complete
MVEIFILSIVQGITEFLPISSSSHLILITKYFDFSNQQLSIDVALHVGSFMAVIVFFRNDMLIFLKNKSLLLKFVVASIPVLVVGFFLIKYDLVRYLRNVEIIGWTTLIFGILLYVSDKFKKRNTLKNNFSIKIAILIGLMQILSLVPGVSRSGITITGARFLSFKRYDSAKISFLLSVPTLAIISLYGIKNLVESNDFKFSFIILFSILFSYLFSYFTIKYFLKYIKKLSLNIFVFYRIILGSIILISVYL